MADFEAKRVTHEYVQTNAAGPEHVFPLLCPVREAEWVPGWEYRMIYSQSGVAEMNCVFTTPNPDGSESFWVVTEYDPASFRIGFCWIHPGMVATQISIFLEPDGSQTKTKIRYVYTGLSAAGNTEVAGFDRDWFVEKMKNWEVAINHYLRTKRRIETGE